MSGRPAETASGVRPPLDRPVFAVGDAVRTWDDVVAAARAWSDWSAIESTAGRVEAALARRAASDAAILREVERRATEFRYSRGLLSADETSEWFAAWGIPLSDWLGYLGGTLLAERAGTGAGASPGSRAAAWIEGVVSGTLERAGQRLAEAFAMAGALDRREPPAFDELPALAEHFERWAASPTLVEAVISDHRLDWTSLELTLTDVPDKGVAYELLYAVRDEGRPIAGAAAEAAAKVSRLETTLDEVPDDLAPRLASARAGDIVGPLAVSGGWRIVEVHSRREATVENPGTVARAREHLRVEALRREAAQRVRWLDLLAVPRR